VNPWRAWSPVVGMALLLPLSGCDRNQPGQPDRKPPPAPRASAAPAAPEPVKPSRPERLNVILLTIDSLRADMPWTGYDRAIAPNLAKLAEQSVVYTNAYAISSYTAKSVAAMLTGRYPSTLYRTGWFFAGYSAANLFFTEVLQERGIRTLAWHAHLYFGRGKGLEQGFDVWEIVKGISFDAQTDRHVTSHKMTELGMELLGSPDGAGKQFFAWAHYMDPHDIYVKHEEAPDFGNKNRDRYDSEVFYTDLWVGKLLDWAKQQPWWKDTAVLISADHGEAFGEHGMYKHAFELWEVLVRVPLIVYAPGAQPKRIEERRSHIDLAPTIMDLLGEPRLEQFMGESLAPEVYGLEPPKKREVIVTELAEDSHNPQRRAILVGDYKLIVHGLGAAYFLFNIKDDPGEEKNLIKVEPEKFEEMKRIYQETYAKIPTIEPYGGMKLKSGRQARGPTGPSPAKEPAR
jgi:arylsulfatase A-like enzyme